MRPIRTRSAWNRPRPSIGWPTPACRWAARRCCCKGINDNVDTLKTLYHNLLRCRVRPYYLYQCDPITGSSHFRTPVEKGIEIIEGLRGHTTGYAVPHFVVDAPGGGGKIPLIPDYVVGREGDDLLLRNFEGNVYRYKDPDGTLGAGRKPGTIKMRVGLTYDLRDDYRAMGFSEEATAEFDSRETIDALTSTLQTLGFVVDRIGHVKALAARLVAGERWDIVFNIAEGLHGRGREAQVPALLEAFEQPFVLSDSVTCGGDAGQGTDEGYCCSRRRAHYPRMLLSAALPTLARVQLPFPLFIKPLAEGTGKGCEPRLQGQ